MPYSNAMYWIKLNYVFFKKRLHAFLYILILIKRRLPCRPLCFSTWITFLPFVRFWSNFDQQSSFLNIFYYMIHLFNVPISFRLPFRDTSWIKPYTCVTFVLNLMIIKSDVRGSNVNIFAYTCSIFCFKIVMLHKKGRSAQRLHLTDLLVFTCIMIAGSVVLITCDISVILLPKLTLYSTV